MTIHQMILFPSGEYTFYNLIGTENPGDGQEVHITYPSFSNPDTEEKVILVADRAASQLSHLFFPLTIEEEGPYHLNLPFPSSSNMVIDAIQHLDPKKKESDSICQFEKSSIAKILAYARTWDYIGVPRSKTHDFLERFMPTQPYNYRDNYRETDKDLDALYTDSCDRTSSFIRQHLATILLLRKTQVSHPNYSDDLIDLLNRGVLRNYHDPAALLSYLRDDKLATLRHFIPLELTKDGQSPILDKLPNLERISLVLKAEGEHQLPADLETRPHLNALSVRPGRGGCFSKSVLKKLGALPIEKLELISGYSDTPLAPNTTLRFLKLYDAWGNFLGRLPDFSALEELSLSAPYGIPLPHDLSAMTTLTKVTFNSYEQRFPESLATLPQLETLTLTVRDEEVSLAAFPALKHLSCNNSYRMRTITLPEGLLTADFRGCKELALTIEELPPSLRSITLPREMKNNELFRLSCEKRGITVQF